MRPLHEAQIDVVVGMHSAETLVNMSQFNVHASNPPSFFHAKSSLSGQVAQSPRAASGTGDHFQRDDGCVAFPRHRGGKPLPQTCASQYLWQNQFMVARNSFGAPVSLSIA